MPIARPQSTPHHRRMWMLLCTGLLSAVLVAALRWLPATAHGRAPESDAAPATHADERTMVAGAAAPATHELPRVDASPACTPEPPPRSFEQRVDDLVQLGQEVAAFAQQDEIEQAKAQDVKARAGFADLMESFADAGERGLAMLTGLPSGPPHQVDAGRRVVLRLVIAAECARRHAAAEAAGDRARIDAFVAALLAVLPQQDAIAELGRAVLEGKPYLRLAHEVQVLELVRLAGDGQFSRSTATKLLLTLWDNLQSNGERSSAELASFAMLLLADADPSKRTAACRQLLRDPRYRHVVLAWLRERNDVAVASEVAGLAARELPPQDALTVLRELAPTLANMQSAYMVLGHRAPEALVGAYQELLAADTHAAMRSDLIAGLGMTNTAESLPIVELALQSDPSPAVRVQAMLSLTATAPALRGEQACNQVLDDPVLASDPSRLAMVVWALQNLEVAGLTNAVDRLGQRLRNTPLRDDSRKLLDQLLARALPGGGGGNR